jgi:acetylornithine/N-succinyldiaminopimelate aminotransferase
MSNQEIIDKANSCIMNTYKRFPIALKEGNGVYVNDYDGKEYLDFLAGISVNALGYNHPEIAETIVKLSTGLIHTSNLFYTKNQTEVADKLVKNSTFDKAFFCNSGAEANEGAIKLARKWGKGRYEIITAINSFHGRTLATVTATGQTKYQKGFEPLVEGFKHVPYKDLDAIKSALTDKTVAIMLEAIQAEGGVLIPSKEYIQGVEKICRENNLLLIFDEVQTGLGRTGKIFAHQHFDVSPDIITLAKALGGGLPIGILLAKDSVAQSFEPGNHASTFGGGEFVTGIALKFLEILIDKKLYINSEKMGKILLTKLEAIKQKYPEMIKEARGLGLLCGIEFVESINASEVGDKLVQNGLLAAAAGSNIIRFAPPLIVNENNIEKAIEILDNVLLTLKK